MKGLVIFLRAVPGTICLQQHSVPYPHDSDEASSCHTGFIKKLLGNIAAVKNNINNANDQVSLNKIKIFPRIVLNKSSSLSSLQLIKPRET